MEITDALKYPFEKLVYFVAALIPGATALLIYRGAVPGSFEWFLKVSYLGYTTKLWLAVLAAFVIGHTLTSLLTVIAEDVGFVIGYWIGRWLPVKSAWRYDTAPWRSPEWRKAIKSRLGDTAPKDTHLLTDQLFKQRQPLLEAFPEPQQRTEFMRLVEERISTSNDDIQWQRLYKHYHEIVVEPRPDDVTLNIRNGLTYNFLASALYILASAFILPPVRHWWCIVPAISWVAIVVIGGIGRYQRLTDDWSTLQAQIVYLSSKQA
jgi:hypothetical protein